MNQFEEQDSLNRTNILAIFRIHDSFFNKVAK